MGVEPSTLNIISMNHTLAIESGTRLDISALATVSGNKLVSCQSFFSHSKYHVLRRGLRVWGRGVVLH